MIRPLADGFAELGWDPKLEPANRGWRFVAHRGKPEERRFTIEDADLHDAVVRLTWMSSEALKLKDVGRANEIAFKVAQWCKRDAKRPPREELPAGMAKPQPMPEPDAVVDEGLHDPNPDEGKTLDALLAAVREYEEAGGVVKILVENVVTGREFGEANEDRLKRIERKIDALLRKEGLSPELFA